MDMVEDEPRRVGMGLLFYPRGGSAQVVRYLSAAVAKKGWATDLATGSLGDREASTNAATFFGRDDLIVADYTDAARVAGQSGDAMSEPLPHHPSYEDRPGVPDRVFAMLDDSAAERQVSSWARILEGSAWRNDALFHLHHLTPIHAAAERCFPTTRRLTHLHGTELKFIAEATADPPPTWRYAASWVERMRLAAATSAHIVCISEHDRDLAGELLHIDAGRTSVIPNGVDTEIFDRRNLDTGKRLEFWRRWLVDDPLGWDESGEPGTISYEPADLAPFRPDSEPVPVLLFVGRFLGFKRVDLLVRAYGRARREYGVQSPLVIWGGSPGEWEGAHPHTVAEREAIDGVYFVGWRGHDELPDGLACSDILVAPSVNEPFGQVYLEAMACGLPVIGTTTGGPLSFVNTHAGEPNGWLVEPDEEGALAAAIAEAVGDPAELRRRGGNAYRQIRADYSWDSLAGRFIDLYEECAT